jgi:hypothetical protein
MIRRLHEGTLKPRPKPKGRAQTPDQPQEGHRRVAGHLRLRTDALKRNTYWPRIISQLRDGLI